MSIPAASADEAVGKAKRMVARLDLSDFDRIEVTRSNEIIVYSFPFVAKDAVGRTRTSAQ